MAFADNLRKLPGIAHLEAILLLDGEKEVGRIEHKPGQVGALAIYNHLGLTYGALTPQAARAGLELYAEQVEEARAHPGRHPHIDRLIEIAAGGPTLRLRYVFCT